MIQRMIDRAIAAQERQFGVQLDYLRDLSRTSRSAFFKFGLLTPLVRHRRVLTHDVQAAAALVATRHQDCGACVQICINLARQRGVDASTIRAVLDDRSEDLPPEVALACRFAASVVAQHEDPDVRERARATFGDEGLVELALTVATAQVYPIVKRAMGHATSCTAYEVAV